LYIYCSAECSIPSYRYLAQPMLQVRYRHHRDGLTKYP